MMMAAELDRNQEVQPTDAGMVSLCSMMVGDRMFGIDTNQVRQVLEDCAIQRIPLAPFYVAGVIPNRGEVLTTLSLRALLGLDKWDEKSSVLVLEAHDGGERFGLVVDSVPGVMTVKASALEANPSTLEARSKALFDGAYKLAVGLMVRLATEKLRPSRVGELRLFQNEERR